MYEYTEAVEDVEVKRHWSDQAQNTLLGIAAWWKIYRVIKAFYLVLALLLVYLQANEAAFGLTLIDPFLPWWTVVFIFGLVAILLEDGQPVLLYFGSLLPIFLYGLVVTYGVMSGTLNVVGLLPITYLTFGCLGFVSGIYGTWRVRELIRTVHRLRRSLEREGLLKEES